MPYPTDNSKTDATTIRTKDYTTFPFWVSVFGGTTVAGGAFGFLAGCSGGGLEGGIFCSVAGVVFASMYGGFTIVNVAFVTWCFWLSRFRVVMGGLAGGLTGVLSTPSLSSGVSLIGSWKWLALAGLLGTLGGGLAGGWCHSRAKARGLDQVSQQHRLRFTLRDLFIRVTAISALLAAYVFVVNRFLAVGR